MLTLRQQDVKLYNGHTSSCPIGSVTQHRPLRHGDLFTCLLLPEHDIRSHEPAPSPVGHGTSALPSHTTHPPCSMQDRQARRLPQGDEPAFMHPTISAPFVLNVAGGIVLPTSRVPTPRGPSLYEWVSRLVAGEVWLIGEVSLTFSIKEASRLVPLEILPLPPNAILSHLTSLIRGV